MYAASLVNGTVDLTGFTMPVTIKLDPYGYAGIGNNTGEISIHGQAGLIVKSGTDATTGNNLVTIDGGNQSPAAGGTWFSFYDGDNFTARGSASFSNLDFINCIGTGDANHNGGGVINYQGGASSSLTLDHCNFSGNSDELNGGAVYCSGGTLTVSNCTFTNNSAAGIFPGTGYGGDIYSIGPTTIDGVTMTNNTALTGGGAVFTDPSTLTVISSTISGNSAPLGADIYNLDSSASVINSTIGGLYNAVGTVTLINSTVSNISNNGGTVTTSDGTITNLNSQVSALSQAGTLTANQEAGLTSKLLAAQKSLDNTKLTPGVNQLNAFINQLNAFVKSGTLTSAQVQPLIDGANQLISAANVGGAHLLNDPGNTTTTDTQPVTDAGQLVTGPVGVYLANADGTAVPADEQARFDDAIATLDTTFGPNGVDLVDVGVAGAANAVVQVQIADTSAAGSAADGVLGCTVAGNITMLTGWSWFTGADPTTIGAGQYDFETIVMHELGHAVGLGHSGDTGSVMYAYLSPGQTRRVVTTADLSVLDSTSTAPEPLLAAPWQGMAASNPVSALETGFFASEEKPGFQGRNRVESDFVFALLGAEQLPLGSRQLQGRSGLPSRTENAIPVDTVFSGANESPIFAVRSQDGAADPLFDADKLDDYMPADFSWLES
jgi:hypothetical protein